MPETIRNYLADLLSALRGRNPLRQEVEGVRKQCDEALQRVVHLNGIYNTVCAKVATGERLIKEYQRLVDNLKQRITEKDKLISQIKGDYQKRIAEYVALVDELQSDKPADKRRKA